MNAETIQVNGETYHRSPPTPTDSTRKIVVCDRGFVFVGLVSVDGETVVITECSCVRRWGTTKGIGELAECGPLKETKLDPQPTTRVHQLQVVCMIDCKEEAWKP